MICYAGSPRGGAWSRDGVILFGGDTTLHRVMAAGGEPMAADVTVSGTTFETATPRALFDTGVRGLFVERRNHYVVTSDGQRFLLNVSEEDDNLAPLTVVMNWDR